MIVGILAFIVIVGALGDGRWDVVGFTVVIAAILLLMAAGDRKDTKAWLNARDYWADGGPDRRRR